MKKIIFVTIGRRYADLLLNSGYRKFKLIGYCMGGLDAIEAARALLEAGAGCFTGSND